MRSASDFLLVRFYSSVASVQFCWTFGLSYKILLAFQALHLANPLRKRLLKNTVFFYISWYLTLIDIKLFKSIVFLSSSKVGIVVVLVILHYYCQDAVGPLSLIPLAFCLLLATIEPTVITQTLQKNVIVDTMLLYLYIGYDSSQMYLYRIWFNNYCCIYILRFFFPFLD